MKKFKLIKLRKARGFSQRAMADKLCMDTSNYNRRENGLTKITWNIWVKIAAILQAPVEDIYEPDDDHVMMPDSYHSTIHSHNIETNNTDIIEFVSKMLERIEQLETRIRKLEG
ncbi:MAG: helix-turn-helix domain-containing protein [Tannerella sp.]|jgi:DNA-binding XRE family transcriptional regulator|nr:helix-turn-helix domain-containing protein [Tannerella sp.]